MGILTRVKQLIFGSTASSSEMGKIGSDAAGSPATTKDLALIQSLSQYAAGLYAITASAGQPPRIEDLNALYFLVTSQIAYVFQAGIPEWDSTTDYFANISFVTKGGIIYKSLTGTGGTPNTGNDPSSDVINWSPDDAIVEKTRALAAEALLAPKAGPTFTGHVTVPDATSAQDAVSKTQLDAEATTRANADTTLSALVVESFQSGNTPFTTTGVFTLGSMQVGETRFVSFSQANIGSNGSYQINVLTAGNYSFEFSLIVTDGSGALQAPVAGWANSATNSVQAANSGLFAVTVPGSCRVIGQLIVKRIS